MLPVLRFANPDLVARAAADQLAAVVHSTPRTCHVALSGGSTPKRLFQLLASRGREFLPWDRVELWWSDERCVPPDHPDSNYGMANATLITPLKLDHSRIHRMEGERDPEHAAADYEALLIETLGTAPSVDLDFLGMGPDGHCASLHPGSPGLFETERWVIANHVDSPLTNGKAVRITFTPPTLNAARHTRFLVAGADKAATLAKVIEGPKGMFPSQLVQGGDVVWLADDAAAAQLTGHKA
jgi:6-phosphogluconolactonase